MTFYERLNDLVNEFYGKVSEEEFMRMTDRLLEEYLARGDNETEWLVIHYEPTAERLYELVLEGSEELDDHEHVEIMKKAAQNEHELFVKYGFGETTTCRLMEMYMGQIDTDEVL